MAENEYDDLSMVVLIERRHFIRLRVKLTAGGDGLRAERRYLISTAEFSIPSTVFLAEFSGSNTQSVPLTRNL
jgi:hypothetical protein